MIINFEVLPACNR